MTLVYKKSMSSMFAIDILLSNSDKLSPETGFAMLHQTLAKG